MAEHSNTHEMSMDDYFKSELANGKEPNNPFERGERKQRQGRKGSRGARTSLKFKRILIAVCAVILLVLIIWLVVFLLKRSNDGARHAEMLASSIGAQLTTAQSEAKVTLKGESEYKAFNQVYPEHSAMTESRRSCRINGIYMPEWAILCDVEGNTLRTVCYYDYTRLEKNAFGTERKAYLDTKNIPEKQTVAQVEQFLDLMPFSVEYTNERTTIRTYRYCYEDRETRNLTSYIITANFDVNGILTNITDQPMNYIGQLLLSGEG